MLVEHEIEPEHSYQAKKFKTRTLAIWTGVHGWPAQHNCDQSGVPVRCLGNTDNMFGRQAPIRFMSRFRNLFANLNRFRPLNDEALDNG